MITSKWNDIIEQIRVNVTMRDGFLKSRLVSEQDARRLLDEKSGRFDIHDLRTLLDLCNTEIAPPRNSDILRDKSTPTRFQRSFIGHNRNTMLETLPACNYWLERLWNGESDPLIELDSFWMAPRDRWVKGAGSGLPTMILYLRDPERYNIWIPSLNEAIGKLTNREFPSNEFPSNRTRQNYEVYNNSVNSELRQKFNLKPQEIDFILYRISIM